MSRCLPWLCLLLIAPVRAEVEFSLPAFPKPTLVMEHGEPKQVGSLRLLRELHKAGLRGFDQFETADRDYALMRSDSLEGLSAWLELTCLQLRYDLRTARSRNYEGSVFVRLLNMSTSLAQLREKGESPAMPIGSLFCRRTEAWGALPADSAEDVYVIFATDAGLMVFDPPTRQICLLSDFPNLESVDRIRF